MMKKKLVVSIIEVIIGIVLVVASFMGKADEFWSGMGTSLLLIGIIFFVRAIKYNKNDEYREKVDIEVNDERNKYLKLKSWAWAGYLFVISGAIVTIGFKLAGREDLMMMASGSICYIMVLFWISYTFLKKKY